MQNYYIALAFQWLVVLAAVVCPDVGRANAAPAGLPALFSGEPYSLTAEALEDCNFGFVDRERAWQLVRGRLDLCLEAINLLAHEVRQLREWQAVVAEQSFIL